MKARVLSALAAVAACAAVAAPSVRAAAVAPDGPGAPSYFDLARKDCVGTARNSTSKVWFTVAGGVPSDVYWPTVDATNVHTLEYVVTDGHSFTDLQSRDMTYTSSASRSGMACTVVARSASHGYRITTTYIADPSHDAVLMRVHFEGRQRRWRAGACRLQHQHHDQRRQPRLRRPDLRGPPRVDGL
jgi:glucoamylase